MTAFVNQRLRVPPDGADDGRRLAEVGGERRFLPCTGRSEGSSPMPATAGNDGVSAGTGPTPHRNWCAEHPPPVPPPPGDTYHAGRTTPRRANPHPLAGRTPPHRRANPPLAPQHPTNESRGRPATRQSRRAPCPADCAHIPSVTQTETDHDLTVGVLAVGAALPRATDRAAYEGGPGGAAAKPPPSPAAARFLSCQRSCSPAQPPVLHVGQRRKPLPL